MVWPVIPQTHNVLTLSEDRNGKEMQKNLQQTGLETKTFGAVPNP
jgi:hypothetical protein